MDKLSKNELFLIAIQLDLPELLNFCISNKKFNSLVCNKDDIWYNKLNKDYPNWREFNINKSVKNIYKILYELEILKKKIIC